MLERVIDYDDEEASPTDPEATDLDDDARHANQSCPLANACGSDCYQILSLPATTTLKNCDSACVNAACNAQHAAIAMSLRDAPFQQVRSLLDSERVHDVLAGEIAVVDWAWSSHCSRMVPQGAIFESSVARSSECFTPWALVQCSWAFAVNIFDHDDLPAVISISSVTSNELSRKITELNFAPLATLTWSVARLNSSGVTRSSVSDEMSFSEGGPHQLVATTWALSSGWKEKPMMQAIAAPALGSVQSLNIKHREFPFGTSIYLQNQKCDDPRLLLETVSWSFARLIYPDPTRQFVSATQHRVVEFPRMALLEIAYAPVELPLHQCQTLNMLNRGSGEGLACTTERKFLVWQLPPACDGQGLSDRRACLAIILAEAFLLGRVAVLPRFTLDSKRHNHGIQLPDKDLREYISLEKIPIEAVSFADFAWEQEDALVVRGAVDPREWRRCDARVILRPCVEGFWKNEVHDTVHHLAGEIHGQGMKPTSGLFTPSWHVLEAANRAAQHIGTEYVGVHVRRGDKLEMMPGLSDATTGESVALLVSQLAPPGVRHVYVASNDPNVDFSGPLHKRDMVFHCAKEILVQNNIHDNHLLFAIEMKLVDDAVISIRTFNDSTPWYFTTKSKPAYHLIDRSMHDYIFGFSAMGSAYCRLQPPIALEMVDPDLAYDMLCEAGPDRNSFLGVIDFPRSCANHFPTEKTLYFLAIFGHDGQQPPIFIPMRNLGRGAYTANVAVADSDLAFRIVIDGDLRRSLFPKRIGLWPFEREVVSGPGTPPDKDLAWWLEGGAPGDTTHHCEVWLDTTGKRSVIARRVL